MFSSCCGYHSKYLILPSHGERSAGLMAYAGVGTDYVSIYLMATSTHRDTSANLLIQPLVHLWCLSAPSITCTRPYDLPICCWTRTGHNADTDIQCSAALVPQTYAASHVTHFDPSCFLVLWYTSSLPISNIARLNLDLVRRQWSFLKYRRNRSSDAHHPLGCQTPLPQPR